MDFKIAGIMLRNWLAGKPIKKIYAIHKGINELKKMIANKEPEKKFYMQQAAEELERSYEYGGKYKSVHMERKGIFDRTVNEIEVLQLFIHEQVVSLEILLEKEMQDGFTTKKPFRLCFS